MDEEYITLNIEFSVKRSDVIKAMKKRGLKINKSNENKYIGLLKCRRYIANEEFAKVDYDKQELLLRGLRFENKNNVG